MPRLRFHRLLAACLTTALAAAAASCGGAAGTDGTGSAAGRAAGTIAPGAGSAASPAAGDAALVGAGAGAGTDAGAAGTAAVELDPFAPLGAGIARCPEPPDAVQFDPARGFVFDAAFQRDALAARLAHLRCVAGVGPLAGDARLDAAADAHAAYSILHGTVSHDEDAARALYTGATPGERLRAAGYTARAWGEVLSRTGPLADEASEGLTAAIYHRLAMLVPQFDAAGVGLRHDGAGNMVAVADYAAASAVPAAGRLIPYPVNGQRNVPVAFDSDREVPDPAPDAGVVGYPVSLQADRGTTLRVDAFELVRAADGAAVAAVAHGRGPGAQADAWLDPADAFLLPHAPLAADTEYEARLSGWLDGTPIAHRWRFRTLAAQPLAAPARAELARGAYARVRLAGCSPRYSWTHTAQIDVSLYAAGWMQVRGLQPGEAAVLLRDACGRTQRIEFSVR